MGGNLVRDVAQPGHHVVDLTVCGEHAGAGAEHPPVVTFDAAPTDLEVVRVRPGLNRIEGAKFRGDGTGIVRVDEVDGQSAEQVLHLPTEGPGDVG